MILCDYLGKKTIKNVNHSEQKVWNNFQYYFEILSTPKRYNVLTSSTLFTYRLRSFIFIIVVFSKEKGGKSIRSTDFYLFFGHLFILKKQNWKLDDIFVCFEDLGISWRVLEKLGENCKKKRDKYFFQMLD